MMREVYLYLQKAVLGIAFCALCLWLSGCSSGFYAQPGETAAEGHRRHRRNLSINRAELMQDLDKAWLLDKPSKLTDKRIP
jgi:hypothetical protein